MLLCSTQAKQLIQSLVDQWLMQDTQTQNMYTWNTQYTHYIHMWLSLEKWSKSHSVLPWETIILIIQTILPSPWLIVATKMLQWRCNYLSFSEKNTTYSQLDLCWFWVCFLLTLERSWVAHMRGWVGRWYRYTPGSAINQISSPWAPDHSKRPPHNEKDIVSSFTHGNPNYCPPVVSQPLN